ncbi:MAG TPA: hypothetical protein VN650_04660 [Gemmatimonadaceae bacterium]|nr:hypothetical protein [Gemmatimonadaceae bacterium]
MTAKFISTVLRAASVAAVPVVMLAVSVPAGAQRPDQHDHSEWQRDNGHSKNAHYKNGHYKNKNRNYKNGYYRNGRGDRDNNRDNDRDDNGRYNDGRYGNGQYGQYPAGVIVQRPVYSSRGVEGKSLPAQQRGNGYPSRGETRYPSAPVIPGFPNPNVPNGRSGKVLPGANQQNQQNNPRYRRH